MAKNTNAKQEFLNHIAHTDQKVLCASIQKGEDYGDDDEIIERLTSIKGVGVWTAQMLLIFHLGRLDVLPIHDLGIQKGFQTLKSLDALPKPKLLVIAGEVWKPYRTIASWYLWRAN